MVFAFFCMIQEVFMSAPIPDSKAFRTYYSDLLKQVKKAPSPSLTEDTIETVYHTFKALREGKGEVRLKNHSIEVSRLKGDDLKVFAEFSKKFFKNVFVEEKKAMSLFHEIGEVHEKLQKEGVSKKVLRGMEEAKHRVVSYMQVDEGKSLEDPFLGEIGKALKIEQEGAQQLDKKLSKLKKFNSFKYAGRGVFVGGMATMLGAFFLLPLFPAGFFIMVIGAGVHVFVENKLREMKSAEREIKTSSSQIEQLERFKQNSELRKGLSEFLKKNGLEDVFRKEKSIGKCLTLYELETKFHGANDALEKKKSKEVAVSLKEEIDRVGELLKQANALRVELELEPIKPQLAT